MEDRRRSSDHKYRGERSPVSRRYRDRSSERYRDRSSERYRSSRYRERGRSRSRSMERKVDRHRRSKSRSHRRSTSRGRYRSSRSRSPRHSHHSSRYVSSSKTKRRKSHSSSKSPSRCFSPRIIKELKRRNSSTREERIAPPPPSFTTVSNSAHDSDNEDSQNAVDNAKKGNFSDTYAKASGSSSHSDINSPNNSNSESAYAYDPDLSEPIDKEKIHREMEEKLRLALAKEGKIYPPPKPEASHPVFANDGSFLEIFKKMQEQMSQQQANAAEAKLKNQPLWAKRRGGKILKTGIVAKTRANDGNSDDPKDFWSIYLQEVKKYKSASCDVDSQTRPLVK